MYRGETSNICTFFYRFPYNYSDKSSIFGASVKQNLEVVNIQNILYKNAYRALTSFCQDFLLFIIASFSVYKLVSGKHD